MKYFYSEYIEIDTVVSELDSFDFSEEQKMHLAVLLDSMVHYSILDNILSKLNEEDRKTLIFRIKEDPQDKKILDYLSDKIEGLEEFIRGAAERLIEDFLSDIKEIRKLKRD